MARISETLARLAAARMPAPGGSDALRALAPAGSNPGALAAWSYVPADLAPRAPLVVILHGCTQNAAGYDLGTGWSALAERAGFALLFPEQRRGNNMNLCFNWFERADIARLGGEAESIAQLTQQMIAAHGLDRERIFVTGLSAGGAMTAVMLATWPDLFAGGAIIGGLPYDCANGVSAALERMAGRYGSDTGVAAVEGAWADHPGRKPTVSIWHGSADKTVTIANLDHLALQWRGVHGVEDAVPLLESGAGWTRESWHADGDMRVETWRIAGMGHGVPIDPSGKEGIGAIGPYMLEAGIDSTAMIARSWGLLPAIKATASPPPITPPPRKPVAAPARPPIPAPAPGPVSTAAPAARRTRPVSPIQGVIEDALRAAGLMK